MDVKEEPVCGSDLVTFSNECELKKAACAEPGEAQTLAVLFYGNCSEQSPVIGDHSKFQQSCQRFKFLNLPVSATLSPSVILMRFNSVQVITASPFNNNSTSGLTTAVEREACRDIHCDFEATCELGPDGFPRCTCQFDCTSAALLAASKPVCASDLRMYPSLCAMKMEACQRQEELRLRPLDLCQG